MDLCNLSHSSSDTVEVSSATCKLMDEECSATKNKKHFGERNIVEICVHEGSPDEDSDFDKPLICFSKKYLKRKNDTHGTSRKSKKPKFTPLWHPKDSRRPLIDDAPVFYPNEEEFKDPLAYIASIREEAEKYGICRIVPPASWKPPCLVKYDKFWRKNKFATRVQQVDKLQNREPMKTKSKNQCQKKRKRRGRVRFGTTRKGFQSNVSEDGDCEDSTVKFCFQQGSHYTLEGFFEYAEAYKKQYFGINGKFESNEKPSVEEIEGEYWRIVENPSDEVEVLYGADLETSVFGSGFPKAATSLSNGMNEYVHSGWNLNNFPRLPGSVLSYENEDISGVIVPWLYIGMCFSSFCWHVEDHHMYSLNYMHHGDPKIWYGVPGSYACKFEQVMRKHLPKLFKEQPTLLHDLVTQLSPSILKSEGVPVYRAIQKSGEFVLTFPRGYHSGFNCGFNCAEAVNVAPIDWLLHGQRAIELYREQKRITSISHDKLLFCAVREAVKALLEISLFDKGSSENLKWKLICEDGVLTSAVKERVMMEEKQREALSSVSESKKMSKDIELAEKECFFCSYDLNMSAACCPCSPNKYSCLAHAYNICSCNSSPTLLYRYSLDELNMLVKALEGNLDAIKKCAIEIFNLDVLPHSDKCANRKQCDSNSDTAGTLPITNVVMDERLLHDNDPKPEQVFNEWRDSEYNSDDVPRSTAECKSSVSSNHSSDALCSKDSQLVCKSSTKLFGTDLNDFMVNSYIDESRSISNPQKYHVEPLHYGTLELGKHWCNKEAIFPEGFRSQVQFLSVLNPTKTCFYISEILDAGQDGPLFKVSLKERPEVTFMHSSATQCWDIVRERVNLEISKLHSLLIHDLPPLQPDGSINGLEMFGLLSPSIVQVIEDLDANRACTEYWSTKLSSQPINELCYLEAETSKKNMHNMLFGADITVSEKEKPVNRDNAPVQS